MQFSKPLGAHNKSKSKPKTFTKPSVSPKHQKAGLTFKPKTKPLVDVPTCINLSQTIILAGSQTEKLFDIQPYQELFIESGRRVVSCKIEVKDESIPHSFWLGDPQSQNMYQSFDTCLVSSATKLRIVARCPEVEKTTQVVGSLELSFEGIQRKINIALKMICEVPKIVCLTNLQNVQKGYSLIRLPVKNKNISSVVPFKNDSPMDLRFEINLIGYEKQGQQKYDILTQKAITVKKSSKFTLQFDIKQNRCYEGPNPQIYTIRKLIQINVPGCKQFFIFPLQVLVYEVPQTI